MIFSAAAWSYEWSPPYDKAIEAIAALGFGGVELCVKNREQITGYYTPETNKALRALIESKGMKLTNLAFAPTSASSTNPTLRARSVEDFRQVADIAVQLGAELITVCGSYPFEGPVTDEHFKPSMQLWTIDYPGGDTDFEQNFNDYLNTLREYAAICAEKSLRMAIEPTPSAWARNTDSLLRILDKLALDHVGVTYDVANITMIGEFAEIFAYRINKRIFHVQMADNHGLSNAHWRPGKGKNDFNALVRALIDIGYDGPVGLELTDATGAAGNADLFWEPHGDYTKLAREHRLAVAELERVYREERP